MKVGRYVLPDSTPEKPHWIDVKAVGLEDGTRKEIAVYYICGTVNSKGSMVHHACPVSELKKKFKLRPIEDKDYPGGSAAAYYRGS